MSWIGLFIWLAYKLGVEIDWPLFIAVLKNLVNRCNVGTIGFAWRANENKNENKIRNDSLIPP